MRIFEARRNPELNIKTPQFIELLKYKGQKDVFVTFTAGLGPKNQNKIGINPNNIYNTPTGIYIVIP